MCSSAGGEVGAAEPAASFTAGRQPERRTLSAGRFPREQRIRPVVRCWR